MNSVFSAFSCSQLLHIHLHTSSKPLNRLTHNLSGLITSSRGIIAEKPFPDSGVTMAQADAWPSSVDARRQYILLTGRMSRSGKLPVLDLLTGQKADFSPRRGDSLHRFTSNLAGPTGTWVRLAVQHFTSVGAWRWETGPKISKNSTFW